MRIFKDDVSGLAARTLLAIDLAVELLPLVPTHATPHAKLDVVCEGEVEAVRPEWTHVAQLLGAR